MSVKLIFLFLFLFAYFNSFSFIFSQNQRASDSIDSKESKGAEIDKLSLEAEGFEVGRVESSDFLACLAGGA